MEFLKRVLNAQLAVTLLAWLSATVLRLEDKIPPDVWKDVINSCLLFFVGGGLLKDGFTSYVNRATPTDLEKQKE